MRFKKTALAVGIGAIVLTVDYIRAAYELYAEKHPPIYQCQTWCKCRCNTVGCSCHDKTTR